LFKGREGLFSINCNDCEKYKENGVLLIDAYKVAIRKYKGTSYSSFYNYIYPYISANKKIIAKYETIEYISSLTDEETDQRDLILEEQHNIDEEREELCEYKKFLSSLTVKNETERDSLDLMINYSLINDCFNDETFIFEETASLENNYYENIESYFQSPSEDIESELNNVFTKDEKEKYLFQPDKDEKPSYRSNMNLFEDILLTSDNSDARKLAGELLDNVCGELSVVSNSDIVSNILSNRLEIANINGCKNFFDYTKDSRSIKNKEDVDIFLDKVLKYVKPKAKKELEELRIFVKNKYSVDNLKLNDLLYYIEKYKKFKYSEIGFDINDYFTVKSVIQGGLDLVEKIFEVKFIENKDLLNDKNILCYDIWVDGKIILNAFLDLYDRPEKQISGFITDILPRVSNDIGVLYVSCSFSEVLNLGEIENYLHELGHCVHDSLLKSDFYNLSGTERIHQDLIEIPSMTFEKFLFNKDFFEIVKKKKEILNYDIIEKASKIYDFFSAYDICRQISYAYYDLELHSLEGKASLEELDEMFEDIVNRCIPAGMYKHANTVYSFEHIFSNGYEAHYYCYVLSNCYASLFYSNIIENPNFVKEFKSRFLEVGRSDDIIGFIKENENEIYDKLIDYYSI